jgi:hypothetical protein
VVRHGEGRPREVLVEERAHRHGAQQRLEYVQPCASSSSRAVRGGACAP